MYLKILTDVALKVSTQATESSVAVGPAVVKVSKSSLKVQTSENDQKYCYLLFSNKRIYTTYHSNT